ncbi:helix-turn-helix transcriptional regulator [Paracoccus sanguinis]|uniref:helix-turn-helix transcriptional regulator n=1 Tax=Paracoccus sanguinis TaxID=1545044 RepID=UPI0014529BF6|nr:helix-turn-helix domain-containing protein [Paracoccus sanguinis]QJD18062.1 helix-turn-helix domain-containing protein [Paracoccus sanguinis]
MLQRHCLNQKELARRWGISHRTLERWRYNGQGPAFLKLGGRVLYRLADIEAFEQSQLQRALKISEAVARVGHTPRRLTADPVRDTGHGATHQRTARLC